MWCSNCQQETPGVAHAASGKLVCSRCQQPMRKRGAPHTARICDEGLALDEPPTRAAAKAPSFQADDWTARQRVRTAVRELRRPNPATASSISRPASDSRRFDPPHDLFSQIDQATIPTLANVAPPLNTNSTLRKQGSPGSQILAWIIVLIGAAALTCGIWLIAWSLSTGQLRHWNLAVGLALGGQGGLILGLVLVISRLWRSSRYAAARLLEVHARLGQLVQATDTLAATRTTSAPAFYADLVRGSSPHVLLANLKGQVDQLATRVGGY